MFKKRSCVQQKMTPWRYVHLSQKKFLWLRLYLFFISEIGFLLEKIRIHFHLINFLCYLSSFFPSFFFWNWLYKCVVFRWQDNFVWASHLKICIFHCLYQQWENMRCHYVYRGPSLCQRARLTGCWKLKSGVNKLIILLNPSS